MGELLDEDEIDALLRDLPGWEREGETIGKAFDRGDFAGSVEFVRRVAEPAEAMNHHPDLTISWSEVRVSLSTHSAGGLTARDFELARRIEQLA